MRQKSLKNYLEIGVFNGHVFFRIKSRYKVAVDPKFQFNSFRKFVKLLLNPMNIYNKYFEKSSDAFFETDANKIWSSTQIDISLIDGMHEYDYVLRDIENTVNYLQDDGVIIVHDCNPITEIAASSYKEWAARGSKGVWNGDVWKAIVHLRSIRKDINVFVLDCDHGLGIITKKSPENSLSFTQENILALQYNDLNKNRDQLLNLKPFEYFYSYFNVNKNA